MADVTGWSLKCNIASENLLVVSTDRGGPLGDPSPRRPRGLLWIHWPTEETQGVCMSRSTWRRALQFLGYAVFFFSRGSPFESTHPLIPDLGYFL